MPLQKRLCTSPMLPFSPRQRGPATTNSILVVQDNGMLRSSLRRLFESEGYDVYPASQATLSQRLFGKKPPCAVVLDLFRSESEVWSRTPACRRPTRLRDSACFPAPVMDGRYGAQSRCSRIAPLTFALSLQSGRRLPPGCAQRSAGKACTERSLH